jgi:hypothetical protein
MAKGCMLLGAWSVAVALVIGWPGDSLGQSAPPLTPEQMKAPCAELLTPEKIRTFGRKVTLARVTEEGIVDVLASAGTPTW